MRTVQMAAMAAVLGAAAAGALGQTFRNTTPMTVPTNSVDGRATLYPSEITVSGVTAPIGSIVVTLPNLSHTYVGDLVLLLQAPTGQRVLLMSGAFGSGDAVNATLRITSGSGARMPTANQPAVSGTYAVSANATITGLPAPAPGVPYAVSLDGLLGTNANGVWRLYVTDTFALQDNGALPAGWSLTINGIEGQAVGTAFTYQGVLNSGGQPINGDANVRFTLCDDATQPLIQATVAPALTRSFSGVSGGRITTALDFGASVDLARALWLNVEVESPPGSGFVALTPRQAITPAVQAVVSRRAESALRLAPGRQTVLGAAGDADTPGVWFASPVDAPVNRAFVGMRDDDNVGLFNNGWNLRLHSNGNLALGDGGTGTGPRERLTVTGNVQINTGTGAGRLGFGAVDLAGAGSENGDPVFFQRVNTGTGVTELRLVLGNPGTAGSGVDSLRICSAASGGGLQEQIRLQADGNAFKPGGGMWSVLSDASTKEGIEPLSGTLEKLLGLHGYSFTYKPEYVAEGRALEGRQVGLLAQEVERVFPEWVGRGADGKLFVTERATTALMVEALRDLRAEKDAVAERLRAEVAAREAENAALRARLERIERLLEAGDGPGTVGGR